MITTSTHDVRRVARPVARPVNRPVARPVAPPAPHTATPHVRVVRLDPWEHDSATAYLATRGDVVLDAVRPDVLLVLTHAVDEAVITATRAAVDVHAGLARLVVVTDGADDLDPSARRRLGATHLLRRDTTTWPEVIDALHDRVPATTRRLVCTRRPGTREHRLSDREVEVLRRLADGATTSEIGMALNYSERTIKNVVTGVVGRLGVRNRVQAVACALRTGQI